MKGIVKKLTAVILAVMMLVTTLAPPALAALVDNTPDQNDKILQELTGFWGDDKTAQEAVELLRENGLIDGEGNILSDWSGEIYIQDGEEPRHTSVEGLTALLEDEAVSRDTVITVDGTEITLGGFETILEIQREIGRIRETYLQDEVELTQEQASSLYSLYEQLSEEGIALYSTNGADDLAFPSGVKHDVTLTMELPNITGKGTYTATVRLNKTQNKDVTFSYRALSGSVNASGSGSGKISSGQTTGQFTFTVGDPVGRTNGKSAFVVQLYNITNAMTQDGHSSLSHTAYVDQTQTFRYSKYIYSTFPYTAGKLYGNCNKSADHGDASIKTAFDNQTPVKVASFTVSAADISDVEGNKFEASFGSLALTIL